MHWIVVGILIGFGLMLAPFVLRLFGMLPGLLRWVLLGIAGLSLLVPMLWLACKAPNLAAIAFAAASVLVIAADQKRWPGQFWNRVDPIFAALDRRRMMSARR